MSENKETTSLPTMLGLGSEFEVKGNSYTVFPIMIAHLEEFRKQNLFMAENQVFNFFDEDSKIAMNKWLGGEDIVAIIQGKTISARYLFDENNEPMSLEKTMADGWDVTDYKRFFKKLFDLSG